MPTYAETHRRSLVERDAFWRERASLIDWQTPFSAVLDYSRPPFARWFVGGRTNLCHNAIDRHLATRADQPALVFISTETGQRRTYTYADLAFEAGRCAAARSIRWSSAVLPRPAWPRASTMRNRRSWSRPTPACAAAR